MGYLRASGPTGRQMYMQHLSSNGDGTGTTNASVDGSSVEQAFKLTAGVGERYEVHRVIVYIEDNATFTAAKYGGIATLANGVLCEVHDSGGTPTGQLGFPVTGVAHWARLCHDSTPHTYGSGNNAVSVRWTWSKNGEPIYLDAGESIVFTVRDDLSTLVDHSFIAGFVKLT